MKNTLGVAFAVVFLTLVSAVAPGCASRPARGSREPQSEGAWIVSRMVYESHVPLVGDVALRAGYFEESANVPFRGNILYLEGLGDSINNHGPLFRTLSKQGYRVVAFDYMGQGGSGGSMNHTRVLDPVFPGLQIASIAEQVWSRFKRERRDGEAWDDSRTVMGWSTGGLAAYEMASRGWASKVILIAPGIRPRVFVGEREIITQRSLTSARFAAGQDPHPDPIRPTSPLEVPLFATNLLSVAGLSTTWTIPATVSGLVLLSGDDDTYVNRKETESLVAARAPQFRVVAYPGALHEIDNEVSDIQRAAFAEILAFLAGASGH